MKRSMLVASCGLLVLLTSVALVRNYGGADRSQPAADSQEAGKRSAGATDAEKQRLKSLGYLN